MLDNGGLGGDVVDLSPDSITVFQPSGLGEKTPIGQIFETGELKDMYGITEALVNDITQSYYIDRLLDLNNDTRQTLGEAQIRDRLRGEGLNSVFKRQETEFFSRFVSSSFNQLLEEGLLGVVKGSAAEQKILAAGLVPLYIPGDVVKAMEQGQKVYNIKYISPASRIMQTEELQGVVQALDLTLGAAPSFPEMADGYDPDKLRTKINELSGVDEEVSRDAKTIKEIRAARAEAQKALQEKEMIEAGADVGMKVAQAQSMKQGAISGRPKR